MGTTIFLQIGVAIHNWWNGYKCIVNKSDILPHNFVNKFIIKVVVLLPAGMVLLTRILVIEQVGFLKKGIKTWNIAQT